VRPQLPFLHPLAHAQSVAGASNIGRFISTETKVRWWTQTKGALRIATVFWSVVALLSVVAAGLRQTKIENDNPTPREWSFWSRWHLRSAHWYADEEEAKAARVITDWNAVGWYFRKLLERLEDEKLDGKNLLQGETLVEGIGRTGLDISMKSEPWRRGYFQALMGAGRVAEHLEGMARKKGDERGPLYSWETIPGPSNPRPRPPPWDRKRKNQTVPNEDECEDAFPEPEVYYMKILTTKGFDNGQRLDAALAYADWCDFKGLSGTAGNMYDWALDIAVSGLPSTAGNVIDIKTGVINNGKDEFVTQNLFRATTALAVHHARSGNVMDALPIFLSVLRARKSLPPATMPSSTLGKSTHGSSDVGAYIEGIKNVFFDTPYPPPPPSGDTRPSHTLKEACEEVGLMIYIGEILFATSASEREKGLSWTRDSVEAAEAVMWVMDEQEQNTGRERCRECLQTGLSNWKDMTAQMSRLAAQRKQEAENSAGFLGTGLGKASAVEKARKEVERWREEQSQIELRKQKTVSLTAPRQTPNGWMGI